MNIRSWSRRAMLLLGAAPVVVLSWFRIGDGPASVQPAESGTALRVVVHTSRHMLYVVADDRDTILAAPVATAMERDFTYGGRTYRFFTPRGRRAVVAKSPDPVWTVPDWHYYEKAARRGLEPVHLRDGGEVPLSDGTLLVMRDGRPGRLNQFGFFAAFPIGIEIILDGRIFIPPLTSPHRRVPGALGRFKLDLGDGYLIHGTNAYTVDSIGHGASHGCIRMHDGDLERLYELVPVGTPVDIE